VRVSVVTASRSFSFWRVLDGHLLRFGKWNSAVKLSKGYNFHLYLYFTLNSKQFLSYSMTLLQIPMCGIISGEKFGQFKIESCFKEMKSLYGTYACRESHGSVVSDVGRFQGATLSSFWQKWCKNEVIKTVQVVAKNECRGILVFWLKLNFIIRTK